MSRRKATAERLLFKKSEYIIPFPHADFSFEAIDFNGNKIVDKYRENELYVSMCQDILQMTPKGLKAKVAFIENQTDLPEICELIGLFKSRAKDYAALTEMFEAAAARLTAVHAKLI